MDSRYGIILQYHALELIPYNFVVEKFAISFHLEDKL
jgi:hypothetical protein